MKSEGEKQQNSWDEDLDRYEQRAQLQVTG